MITGRREIISLREMARQFPVSRGYITKIRNEHLKSEYGASKAQRIKL